VPARMVELPVPTRSPPDLRELTWLPALVPLGGLLLLEHDVGDGGLGCRHGHPHERPALTPTVTDLAISLANARAALAFLLEAESAFHPAC